MSQARVPSQVGGSGRETGARDVSDCRCEQRPPVLQNRDLSTRAATCPMMAPDAAQRGFLVKSRDEKTSQYHQDSGPTRRRSLSQWIPPGLRRCHLSPVVGGAYQRSASDTPALPMPASNYCDMPGGASRVTGDGTPSACRAEILLQHGRGPDRRSTVAVGFIRSDVLVCRR